jgi:hypothetical protein
MLPGIWIDPNAAMMMGRPQQMRDLSRICFIIFTAGHVLAQCALADDWQCYQLAAAHSGNSGALLNPPGFSLAWTAPTGYATPRFFHVGP